MRRIVLMVGMALTLSAQAAFAQRTLPKPFLRDTIGSAEEYASVIDACEDVPKAAKLVANCNQLVESFNRAFHHIHVADHHQLAEYVRGLAVKPCPSGVTHIARILPTGEVDLTYLRPFREGEMCLYDTGEARFISSVSCGQWTPDARPVFTAMITGNAPKEENPSLAVSNTPGPIAQAAQQAAAQTTPEKAKSDEQDVTPYLKKHYSLFSWHRKSGKIIWGSVAAGAVVCGFECRASVVQITNVNVR